MSAGRKDQARHYSRPLERMRVIRIFLSWPRPQDPPQDPESRRRRQRETWVQLTAFVLALGVAILAVCR